MKSPQLRLELTKALWMIRDTQRIVEAILEEIDKEEILRTQTPLNGLDLTVRTINCLQSEGLMTLEQVAEKSEAELMKLQYLGRKSINEVKSVLERQGMKLKGDT